MPAAQLRDRLALREVLAAVTALSSARRCHSAHYRTSVQICLKRAELGVSAAVPDRLVHFLRC